MMRHTQPVWGTGEHEADHTMQKIGQQLSVSRERIRQIWAKAFRKLKHKPRKMRSFLDQ